MHDKYIVFDGKKVEWGSYNYTNRAENVNLENATFLADDKLALQYHADFVAIYNQPTPEVRGIGRPVRRFLRSLVLHENEYTNSNFKTGDFLDLHRTYVLVG